MNVTYYYPWGYFYPARCGADLVTCWHLDYLRSRGFAPRIVVRKRGTDADRAVFESQYRWAEDVVVLDTQRQPAIHQLIDSWDLGSYLAAHALLAECPEVRKILARRTDIAFLNYVFSAPLLDAIPRAAFRVLESHDLMSHQYADRRLSPARFQRLMNAELELYDLFNLVLMSNSQEDAYARVRCQTNVAYMPRPVPVTSEAADAGRGAEYDLLFVGSDHKPNIEGVHWFYDHVFQPWLRPQGLRWAIVGSVCGSLSFRDRRVTAVGVVDDLGAVYRRSKVVVVPLFRGAGISIKTLEAMGQRMPVVTTPCGRRGLSAEADDALLCRSFEDDPRQLSAEIVTLCSSTALRERYGRAAVSFINRHFGIEACGRRMDALLEPVLGSRSEPEGESLLMASEEDARPRVCAVA